MFCRVICIMLLVCFLGCFNQKSKETSAEEKSIDALPSIKREDVYIPQYYLNIYTESRFDFNNNFDTTYKDDTSWSIRSSQHVFDAVARVNSSPLTWVTAGGSIEPCEQLLNNGSNTISVSGDLGKRMYIKIIKLNENHTVNTVVAKRIFSPEESDMTFSFTIDDLDRTADFDKLDDDPVKVPREISELLGDMLSACQDAEEKRISKLVVTDIPEECFFMKNDVRQRRAKAQQVFSSWVGSDPPSVIQWTDLDDDNLKIIVGKHSVLAYAGVSEQGEPYLIKGKGSNGAFTVPIARFYRFDGKWMLQL